jgi:hypothetical protein
VLVLEICPTVDETACRLKAANYSLTVKLNHDGRYLAEAVSLGGTRQGPTGEGRTPDRAAFMALLLLQQYPDAYAA